MKTIGSIESFTGGLFASTVVSKAGASKYFKGTLVTYNNDLKEKLGIDTSNGVINKQVAIQMALKGKEFLEVDTCVSFTGNAGPEVMDDKPVGLVYISINEEVYELNLEGNRNQIRQRAVEFAINKLGL